MAILLSALGVAFAAFCVWLTVRIVNRREWSAKWTAVVLAVMLVAYPLGLKPAIWLMECGWMPQSIAVAIEWFYVPMFRLMERGGIVSDTIFWWLAL